MENKQSPQELKNSLDGFLGHLSVEAINLKNLVTSHQELGQLLEQFLKTNQPELRRDIEEHLLELSHFYERLKNKDLHLALRELSIGLSNLGEHILQKIPPEV